jgi:hypothetical protein
MNRATFLAKFLVSVSLAVLLLFGLTGPAHATTLTSSPLNAVDGQAFGCAITNAGLAPITVTIQIVSRTGAVLQEFVSDVDPGETESLFRGANSNTILFRSYCKFTGDFNRRFVRANAQVVGEFLATLVVVPAQAVGE